MRNKLFDVYHVEPVHQVVNDDRIGDYNKRVCGNENISSKILYSGLVKVSLYWALSKTINLLIVQ